MGSHEGMAGGGVRKPGGPIEGWVLPVVVLRIVLRIVGLRRIVFWITVIIGRGQRELVVDSLRTMQPCDVVAGGIEQHRDMQHCSDRIVSGAGHSDSATGRSCCGE